MLCFFCFKQKTAYEMRISDWSSDVCSSDLFVDARHFVRRQAKELRQFGDRCWNIMRLLGDKLKLEIRPVERERLAGAIDDPSAPGRDEQIGRASGRARVGRCG